MPFITNPILFEKKITHNIRVDTCFITLANGVFYSDVSNIKVIKTLLEQILMELSLECHHYWLFI